jgi:uncharacterized protein (DUF433 family)
MHGRHQIPDVQVAKMRDNIRQDHHMGKGVETDWSECSLVERIPGKQGGVPLVRGTRIPAEQLVEEAEMGSPIEEIAENYPSITRDQVTALLAYADKHKSQPVP